MATILMADMVLCACGIAKEDCDYHNPQQQDYIVGPVVKQVDFTYQGNGIWKITSDPGANAGGTITVAGLKFKDPANPFFTNDLAKRAKYMCDHPGIAKVDCDYHKPEFERISDGSVIYFRYDEVNKTWNYVHWTAAIETDLAECRLLP